MARKITGIEVVRVLSASHGELTDVLWCSVLSHHAGQVRSGNHAEMIQFPELPFQEPHRNGQGLSTELNYSTSILACTPQEHSLSMLCPCRSPNSPRPATFYVRFPWSS